MKKKSLLRHPKPWLIVGGIGNSYLAVAAMQYSDDFSLFWGCVWAAIGIAMVWAATFLPDPEGL